MSTIVKDKKGIGMVELVASLSLMATVFMLLSSVVLYVSNTSKAIFKTSKEGVSNVVLYTAILSDLNRLEPNKVTLDEENGILTFERTLKYDNELKTIPLEAGDLAVLKVSLDTEAKKVKMVSATKGGSENTYYVTLSTNTNVDKLEFDVSNTSATATYVVFSGEILNTEGKPNPAEFTFTIPVFVVEDDGEGA